MVNWLYIPYHNLHNRGERGVVTYISNNLDSIFLKSASVGPKFVFFCGIT